MDRLSTETGSTGKKFAEIILDKLQLALIANANPGSALARDQREKQMQLW
jgi:hypothetical protein